MDEMNVNPNVKARIAAALDEPSAPAALVERTVARVKAIEAGRDALRTLKQKGDALLRSEKEALAARCVVGQLLTDNAPRSSVNGEELAQQLRELPGFRKLTELSPAELIRKLTDGRTAGSLAKNLTASADRKQQNPVIEAPVKTKPNRSL